MIKGILIVNNHGKPRIVKFYEHVPDAEQQAVIRDIYTQVSKRPDTLCNFLEGTYVPELSCYCFCSCCERDAGASALTRTRAPTTVTSVRYWGDGIKLIYRHYATLYFVFAVDRQESDLGILDLIQGECVLTVRGDARQDLRERVRARPDLPQRQGALRAGRDRDGRHGARDEHQRGAHGRERDEPPRQRVQQALVAGRNEEVARARRARLRAAVAEIARTLM
ncbi:hypothetical protein PybrP1_009888 [[Pythium] brassicae (nom. inval.)]|nr:hypothetical protein PybrP1_009888 [[Pythium] brassicae (nom. inval.)]